MIVRLAQKEEYFLLAKLFAENVDDDYLTATEEDYGRAENGKWKPNLSQVVFEEMERRSDKILILILLEGENIIGYSFSSLENPCHLEDLVIEKSHRGRGLGKFLISETIKHLQGIGFEDFRGEIGPNNLISQNLMKQFENVNIKIC